MHICAFAGEHCDLVVGWGGALGACPTFDLRSAAWTRLTVGGTQYDYNTGCPQGARVAGATITWDVTGRACKGGYLDGWEICF